MVVHYSIIDFVIEMFLKYKNGYEQSFHSSHPFMKKGKVGGWVKKSLAQVRSSNGLKCK